MAVPTVPIGIYQERLQVNSIGGGGAFYS